MLQCHQSYFPFKIAICCQVLNCLDWMILCNEGWSCGRIGPFEVAPTDKKSNFAASAHRWQFIHHFPGNLHLKPCQHFRWALIAPFQNFCKRAHLLRNLRALKHLKGWSKLCLSVPLFLDAIALSVGQSVSQWFIVSDLEMAIASSSFASLFYIRR